MSCYHVELDVHKSSIRIAVLNAEGKLVMESIIETGAATIPDFLKGLRGQVEVTFEEGTHAAWLYDTLRRTKAQVIVRDPLKNRLLQDATSQTHRRSLPIRAEGDRGAHRPNAPRAFGADVPVDLGEGLAPACYSPSWK